MLTTIWDDINHDAEAILILDADYKLSSLSNIIYDIIDDKKRRRKVIKESKTPGLYGDIEAIRSHRNLLISNQYIKMLIDGMFKLEHIASISPLDRVFLNAYYRRLLRAKIERDYIGKELVSGLIVTDYTNGDVDVTLVKTLRILRIVCKFLGITSTTHEQTFDISKLYDPIFWNSVSSNFLYLFGENRITVVDEDDPLDINSMEALMMIECQKKTRQSQVLLLLNVIFNTWSGTMLVAVGDSIKVIPATYISRMLPWLRDL